MWIEKSPPPAHHPRNMDGRIDQPSVIGRRLRALREALGYAKNQAAFARLCDISPRAWNNYELGLRTPSREEAGKVRRVTGVTLDFVYYGDDRSLTLELASKIRAALVAEET